MSRHDVNFTKISFSIQILPLSKKGKVFVSLSNKEAQQRPPIMKNILIIDFEASGLHSDSYPTEIAWMDPVQDDKATSYLIKPTRDWLDSRWDPQAQELTGISQKMIIEHGMPFIDVAKIAEKVIAKADIIL
jgi:hypothetical protein